MRRGRGLVVALAVFAVFSLGHAPIVAAGRSDRASLATVEGIAGSVHAVPDGTGVATTAVRLRLDDPPGTELTVLLAPSGALSESGFEIETGDRIRVRVFLSDDDAVEAHKVMNISRGIMVRLRTLRRVPLWDGDGQWHGGPSRSRGGTGQGGGHQHRGGGPRVH
jgi:hypothetical protein